MPLDRVNFDEDRVLRSRLQEITDEKVGDRVGEQIGDIAALRSQHAHQIEIEEEVRLDRHSTFGFTCFQFAFSLRNPPSVIRCIANRFSDIYPDSRFVQFLIDSGRVDSVRPADGVVIIYRNGHTITHAGIVRGDGVVSKWGLAHTWRHPVLQVPSSYGSETQCVSPLSQLEACRAFVDYARTRVSQEELQPCLPRNRDG